MTKATREALLQVDKILQDAGWDEADEPVADDLAEMEQQLEKLSVTPCWPDLCRTIKEYYRKACDERLPKS